jgi:hypothetical protein
MRLSHDDFRNRLRRGLIPFPAALVPYSEVCPRRFRALEALHARSKHSLRNALDAVRARVDRDQFGKIHALQVRTLGHSRRAFPAYRFILPEVIANDWLASVDWRKFHRDHVVHQPQVAYVALSLLDGLDINGQPLIEHCLDHVLRLVQTGYLGLALKGMGIGQNDLFISNHPTTRGLWRSVFREAAFLAALFHDIGYPWQYANRLEEKLPAAHDGRHPVTPSAEAVLREFNERLVMLPFEGYRTDTSARPAHWTEEKLSLIETCLAESHGLPGALFFLYLNDGVRPYPSERNHPVRRLCIEWAAMAILMHDLQRAYWKGIAEPVANPHLRLKCEVDPLSCVLTLADTVQDFERHSARFSTIPTPAGDELRVRYPVACTATEVDFDAGTQTLRMNYVMNTPRDTVLKLARLPEEETMLFDPGRGFVDFSACGVRRVTLRARTGP